MLQNNLRLALRHLFRDRLTTALHLLGLTAGITGFMLILQYVFFERSYDRFHPQAARVFRTAVEITREGRPAIRSAAAYAGLGPALKNEFPEVEAFTRLFWGESTIRLGDRVFRDEKTWFADADFFRVFDFPLLRGNRTTALADPGSVVLSETMAQRLFGTLECTGRPLELFNYFQRRSYSVAGVMRDMPENSHLKANILLSYSTFSTQPDYVPDWGWRDFKTYLLLTKDSDATRFAEKICNHDYIGKQNPVFGQRNMKHQLLLQPLPSIHLHSDLEQEFEAGGDATSLNFLLLIAALILGMAWMNYLNLSTAKAVERTREIGIRKAIGARRSDLAGRFLSESLLLNVAAFLLALGIVSAVQPLFARFLDKKIGLELLNNAWLLGGALALLMAGMFISAVYPASVMAGWSPVGALRGRAGKMQSGSRVRKGLIVGQFTLSIVLMISTVVVYEQVQYMRKKDVGMQLDQTLVVRAPVPADSTAWAKYQVLREQWLQNPSVRGVAASHNVPGDPDGWNIGIRRYNRLDASDQFGATVYVNAVEPEFIPQFGIQILHGRNLDRTIRTDRLGMIFSESATRRFGYKRPEDALQQQFVALGDTFTVVGVMADYHQFGVREAPQPYVFFQQPNDCYHYSIRLEGTSDFSQTLTLVEQSYRTSFPNAVFEWFFLDEHFDRQYRADVRTGQLFTAFSGLAIFIACLGLFGLAAFSASRRTKEIGIRKVLGDSVAGITGLLAKDFLKLVLLAILIASPVAYWAMHRWLEGFACRIDLQGWMFALAGFSAVVAAFLTVGYQSVKAALMDPVKSLRHE